jgi:hypothetical protein
VKVCADYYIFAIPVERMAPLLDDNLVYLDPTLNNIKTLSSEVSWMNGSQFFLTEDVTLIHGHAIYIDTPWALTSISQKQFWKNVDFSTYGDGKIKGTPAASGVFVYIAEVVCENDVHYMYKGNVTLLK